MKFNEFLNQIAKQVKCNKDLFFIDIKSSKSSHYFYFGTERQLNDFSEGKRLNDEDLIKFRVSDHEAICANSWSHESVILNYYPKSGWNLLLDGDIEIDSNNDKEIANKIASHFSTYF